jgi:glycosyltransferase involved in cell wall biosynthesis
MAGDLVTVLMPVRDTPAWMVEQSVASILGQTYAEFEFLIIDDGSRNPETLAALELTRQVDRRVRIERTDGIGVTRALNFGLSMARGEWIARQDADDWSEPERIARQLEFFETHDGAVLCGTSAWTHQHDGSRLWVSMTPASHLEIVRALALGNPFFHGSAMFRRSVAAEIGGYREEFACSQDYDFFWRLTERGEAGNLLEPLYHYRYGAASVSARRGIEQGRAQVAARKLGMARRRGEVEDLAAAFEGAVGSGVDAELRQVDHAMLAGDYGLAWRGYWNLVRRNPGCLVAWGKLARCGVFVAAPAAREWCFR